MAKLAEARYRIALALALMAGASAQRPADQAPIAHIDAGAVRGIEGWATVSYLGIPFAAPPVGAARWMPPAPPPPWNGVRDATHLALPCATEGFGDGPRTTNEDCLYLNIYAPKSAKRGGGLPVMVFIHGGGNFSGSTTIYDGGRMAEVTHAIVVMPAYRLGVFGSLALPSASKNGGTFILQDNLAALRWVRRNVAAFGGNPHDVTVSGQSSGGTDVCNLLISPAAAGLFRQAIVQSGPCESAGPSDGVSLAAAHAATTALAASMGCIGPVVDACLRAKPASDLIDAWKARSGTAYGTTLLPLSPAAAIRAGRVNRVPLLIGFTRDEWWSFEHGLYPLSADGLQQQFAANFGSRAAAVAALYPEAAYPHREYALGAAVGDSLVICPSLRAAAALAAYLPVSVYEFADRTAPPFKSLNPANLQPRPPGYTGGAGHTAELQYLYAYQSADGPLDAKQKRLADAMIARWVAFGRANPSPWPAFSAAHPVVERIGADGASFSPSTDVDRDHHCGFWDAR
jgi:para-nitrobenzyl esterase